MHAASKELAVTHCKNDICRELELLWNRAPKKRVSLSLLGFEKQQNAFSRFTRRNKSSQRCIESTGVGNHERSRHASAKQLSQRLLASAQPALRQVRTDDSIAWTEYPPDEVYQLHINDPRGSFRSFRGLVATAAPTTRREDNESRPLPAPDVAHRPTPRSACLTCDSTAPGDHASSASAGIRDPYPTPGVAQRGKLGKDHGINCCQPEDGMDCHSPGPRRCLAEATRGSPVRCPKRGRPPP